MKRLIILCAIIGIVSYYYKDGEDILHRVQNAAIEIAPKITSLF